MKKLLLLILCCVFMICGGFVLGGCESDINRYLKYDLLIDGTYSVGLKKEYNENFTIEVEEKKHFIVPSILKKSNRRGNRYEKIPRHIEIPSSYKGKAVTKIADGGFSNDNIESITLPSSITCIGVGAFYGADMATITIPDSVRTIEEYAFAENTFSEITIPNSTKTIGKYAFAKNVNLSTVNLGNGIGFLDRGLFCGCEHLTSIVVPKNISLIEDYAFSYLDEPVGGRSIVLETIYFKGNAKEWKQIKVPDVFENVVKTLYYAENGDIAKFIDITQSVQRVWAYNDRQEIEIINLIYDDAIDGKTYAFSHSDVEITDSGWERLLEYDKDDSLNEILFSNDIEIFKKCNNKDEYEAMREAYDLKKYINVKIIFKDGDVRIWRGGTPDLDLNSYKFVNGEVYVNKWDGCSASYRLSYIFNDGTLIEVYDRGYGIEKFYYKEI